jgi:hypothetical protein
MIIYNNYLLFYVNNVLSMYSLTSDTIIASSTLPREISLLLKLSIFSRNLHECTAFLQDPHSTLNTNTQDLTPSDSQTLLLLLYDESLLRLSILTLPSLAQTHSLNLPFRAISIVNDFSRHLIYLSMSNGQLFIVDYSLTILKTLVSPSLSTTTFLSCETNYIYVFSSSTIHILNAVSFDRIYPPIRANFTSITSI